MQHGLSFLQLDKGLLSSGQTPPGATCHGTKQPPDKKHPIYIRRCMGRIVVLAVEDSQFRMTRDVIGACDN